MNWALIVGASGDIGAACANDLAAQGWSLYLHYHQNETKSQSLLKDLQKKYPKQDFLLIQADLTDLTSAQTIAAQLFSLDAVIFAQGTTKYGFFHDLSAADFQEMLMMQLQTPLELLKLLETKLAVNQRGRIVFIGSVYGATGSAMEVGYSTIKGALSSFVKAYSQEVASLQITANVVAPGAVATQMNQNFSESDKEQISAAIPLRRWAKPSEISYFVTTLLAQEAAYLTGQTLYVTGGWLN